MTSKIVPFPLDRIRIPDRCRKELGNLKDLADSIRTDGLLQPIGLSGDHRLVYGERRLAACRFLGWTEIPVVIDPKFDDVLAAVRAEASENICRKPFTPSEAAAVAVRLHGLEAERARERQREAGRAEQAKRNGGSRGQAPVANIGGSRPPVRPEGFGASAKASGPDLGTPGETRQKVAVAVGMKHATLAKAQTVVARGAPELVRAMDAGDVSVDAAAAVATLPVVEQKQLVGLGEKEILAKAKEIKQRQSADRRQRRLKELTAAAALADTAGRPPPEWEVVTGDAVEVLRSRAVGTARLVVADPPYNVGVDYGQGAAADLLPADDYMAWAERWALAAIAALTPDGSLWLIINDEYVAEHVVLLKRLGLVVRDWVKWHEGFGVNCSRKFNRTVRHVVHFVRDPDRFVFNEDAPLARRPSARLAKYGDPRANPDGKLLDDLWGVDPIIPRVAGTHAERVPEFPTQLPELLLETIVTVASAPGDLVVDPFSGSATTGVAAVRHGRRYLGVEKNPRFAELSRLRMQAAPLAGPAAASEPTTRLGVVFPPEMRTPEFFEAWAEWEENHRKKKHKRTDVSDRKQLKQCVQWGHERAVAALHYSAMQGYQGLIEPKGGLNGSGSRRLEAARPEPVGSPTYKIESY